MPTLRKFVQNTNRCFAQFTNLVRDLSLESLTNIRSTLTTRYVHLSTIRWRTSISTAITSSHPRFTALVWPKNQIKRKLIKSCTTRCVTNVCTRSWMIPRYIASAADSSFTCSVDEISYNEVIESFTPFLFCLISIAYPFDFSRSGRICPYSHSTSSSSRSHLTLPESG